MSKSLKSHDSTLLHTRKLNNKNQFAIAVTATIAAVSLLVSAPILLPSAHAFYSSKHFKIYQSITQSNKVTGSGTTECNIASNSVTINDKTTSESSSSSTCVGTTGGGANGGAQQHDSIDSLG